MRQKIHNLHLGKLPQSSCVNEGGRNCRWVSVCLLIPDCIVFSSRQRAKAVISCLVVGFPSPWGLKNGWGRALVKRHAAKLSLGTFHKPQANLLKHCSAPGHVQRVLGFSICGLINPSLHWVCLWRRDKSNLMQHSKSLKVWSAFCLRPSLCTSQTKGNWI